MIFDWKVGILAIAVIVGGVLFYKLKYKNKKENTYSRVPMFGNGVKNSRLFLDENEDL